MVDHERILDAMLPMGMIAAGRPWLIRRGEGMEPRGVLAVRGLGDAVLSRAVVPPPRAALERSAPFFRIAWHFEVRSVAEGPREPRQLVEPREAPCG